MLMTFTYLLNFSLPEKEMYFLKYSKLMLLDKFMVAKTNPLIIRFYVGKQKP